MEPNPKKPFQKFKSPEKRRNDILVMVLAYLESHSKDIRNFVKQLGSILKASWITLVIYC